MPKTSEKVWTGADLLDAFTVPIDTLKDHPDNTYHQGDVAALMGSLTTFGQVRPVLVDGDTMVAGHHLTKAAKELGWTHIAVIPHKFKDDDERRRYLFADNYLPTLGGYDAQAQMTLVESFGTDLSGTGLTPDAVEDMQAAFNVPTVDPPDRKWEHAEAPEAAAARAAAMQQGQAKRDISLMLDADVAENFLEDAATIGKAYGGLSQRDAIVRAVREKADEVRAT